MYCKGKYKSGSAEAEPPMMLTAAGAAVAAAVALIEILHQTCTTRTTGRETTTDQVTHSTFLRIKYCPSGTSK